MTYGGRLDTTETTKDKSVQTTLEAIEMFLPETVCVYCITVVPGPEWKVAALTHGAKRRRSNLPKGNFLNDLLRYACLLLRELGDKTFGKL